MGSYEADIIIRPRDIIRNPEGEVIRDALHSLGFSEVQSVRTGGYVLVELAGDTQEQASAIADKIAHTREIYVRPVINDVDVGVRESKLASKETTELA